MDGKFTLEFESRVRASSGLQPGMRQVDTRPGTGTSRDALAKTQASLGEVQKSVTGMRTGPEIKISTPLRIHGHDERA